MKRLYTIAILIFIFNIQKTNAQGCVAIRSNGNAACSMGNSGPVKGWQLNLNNRTFKSYKHFIGTAEQKERVDSGTEVINRSFSTDITLTRTINSRWSVSISAPFIANSRSSKYEHYGNTSKSPLARRSTKAVGLGDLRLSAYRWMFDPAKSHKGNLQLGLGLKFATGDYTVQDFFYKNDSTYTMGPVDQSIQLGDGGTGITTEVNGYYNVNHKLGFYGNFFYLISPREQNGVSATRGAAPSAVTLKYYSNTMSVPDQFMARAGMNYMTGYFTFSGGLRVEGVPSSDLVGGDKGFRRPGFVLSAEPVISYTRKKTTVYFALPVAIERNRTQSYSDKLRSADTKTHVQGDAAFADYLVNAGITFRF